MTAFGVQLFFDVRAFSFVLHGQVRPAIGKLGPSSGRRAYTHSSVRVKRRAGNGELEVRVERDDQEEGLTEVLGACCRGGKTSRDPDEAFKRIAHYST